MFSSVDPSLAAVKMRQNILITGGFRMILHNHRRLPVFISRDNNAAVESLKRVNVLKGFLKLVNNFIDKSKDFDHVFSSTRHNKFENFHQRLYKRYLFVIIGCQTKLFIS